MHCQTLFSRMTAILCGGCAFGLAVLPVAAEIPDPTADAGRPFAPFVIRLHKDTEMSPLPPWMSTGAIVKDDLGCVEIPLPALQGGSAAERYVVTVVFDDAGDGGPAVEWRKTGGETVVISEGLGEALDDRPLGLNAQTVLLPSELGAANGTLIVSYFGRFASLASITVQPATESVVAVVGGRSDPALVDKLLRVATHDDTDGLRGPPLSGDVRDGAVVEAELAAGIEKFDGEIEFVVPVEGRIEGTLLVTEILGLDPEASVEVVFNDQSAGVLGLAPFALDGPSVAQDTAGRLVVAGWRAASLIIPASKWKAGENRLILKLKRASTETFRPVFLRATGLHLRFGTDPSAPQDAKVEATPTSEIDFLAAPSFIDPPRERGGPVVITTKP